jgi:transposase
MQGRQITQMPLFVDGNLEKFVPTDHLLRKVARVLDLKFVRRITRKCYAAKGRPSLDPVVYFKMQIIGYLYGIPSDRQLCEQISYNLAFRWYLGYPLDQATPDHSTLTRTRDRLGEEVFKKVFERIVRECIKVGLVEGKQLITDASLIKADAAKESMKEKLGPPKPERQSYGSSAGNGDEIKPKKKEKSNKNETHVSATDPDSTCVNRKGYNGHLYHKAHYTIDGKERVIVDCHVTTGARHECNELIPRLDHVADNFGLDIEEALADSGYGHGPAYEDLEDRGIRSYIPLRDPKLGAGKHAPPEGFQYQKENDRYRCPVGAFLYPHKPSNGFTRYVIKNRECDNCLFQAKCFPDGYKGKSMRIQRSEYQQQYDKVRRRQKTTAFKKKRYERSWKVEGIFGEGKSNHCLGRAKYRGREKVQIQVYLSATVQNLKRIVKAFGERLFTIIANSVVRIFLWKAEILFLRIFFRRLTNSTKLYRHYVAC